MAEDDVMKCLRKRKAEEEAGQNMLRGELRSLFRKLVEEESSEEVNNMLKAFTLLASSGSHTSRGSICSSRMLDAEQEISNPYRGAACAEAQLPLALLHESFDDFHKNIGEQDPTRGLGEEQACADVARRARLGRLGLEHSDLEVANKVWDVLGSNGAPALSGQEAVTHALNVALGRYLDCYISMGLPDGSPTHGLIPYKILDGSAGSQDNSDAAEALLQLLDVFTAAWRFNVRRRMGRLSHAIGILRVMPSIQFVALVMDWKTADPCDATGVIMAEPLTDPIACYGPRALGIPRVARALKAFKTFVKGYQPEEYVDCSVPYLLRAWSSVRPLTKTVSQDSMVFYGKDEQGAERVAKFCSVYSEEAHKAWASVGLAPQLYKVERLASGWIFLVTQYLSGWTACTQMAKRYKKNAQGLNALRASVRRALERAHSTGYVHGDFRLSNIFVKQLSQEQQLLEVKVIDFDWAGVEGKDVYPEMMNPKVKWHKDVQMGVPLQRVHDEHLFLNDLSAYD